MLCGLLVKCPIFLLLFHVFSYFSVHAGCLLGRLAPVNVGVAAMLPVVM